MKNSPLFLRGKAKIEDYISPQTLTKSLLVFILLLLSSQLTKFWWPDTAFVNGIRVDYLAPSISLIDILIFCYLLLKRPKKSLIVLKPLIFIIAISLLISINPLTTLFFSAKLILYSIFAHSLKVKSNKKILINTLLIGLLIQLFLSIAQVKMGSSVGGYALLLGERNVSASSPNVAKSEIFGQTLLRAYGTFSHPNILAGWTVAVIFVLYILKPSTIILTASSLLGTALLVLTQSRTALLVFFIVLIPLILNREKRRYYLVGLLSLALIFHSALLEIFTRHPEAITERINLFKTSLQVMTSYPIFGAGLNSSLSAYPALNPPQTILQPDHFVPTLLLSQLGLFGLLSAFLLKGTLTFPKKRTLLFLAPLLIMDHYFLTSSQGLLILLILWRIDVSIN